MFKKIRDFIYDINDIFVALIILALAAGVIYWRSASIVEYPKYISEKNRTNASSEIDFSDIDLEPEPVDPDFNYDPENQGSLVDPDNPPADNTVDTSDVPVPGGENTADNSNNANNTNNSGNTNEADNSNSSENTNTGDNDKDNTSNNAENTNSSDNDNTGENTEPEIISFMLYSNDSWYNIADRLSAAGLIEDTDTARMDFIMTVSQIGLQASGIPGNYQLTKGMTYEEIIRKLCRIN